ncbi:MAG: MFS transporter [Burkholderiales bacterium]
MSDPEPDAARVQRLAIGVLAVCTALNFLSRGVSDAFAVFLLPLEEEFGADRATLTGIYSVYMLVHGLAAPAIGMIFDRLGPRVVYAGGLACYGIAYILAGSVGMLWQLYVLAGLAGGVAAAAIGMVPASGLVSRWFRTRLPMAMGVLYASLGTGLLLFAPVTQWLIDSLGWRGAYRVLGASLLVMLVPLLLLPWRRMAAGHPDYAASGIRRTAQGAAWTLSRALGTTAFWALFGVMFVTSLSTYAVNVQVVVYLIGIGFTPLKAASIYGLVGMLSVVGMLGAGVAAGQFGERAVATFAYACSIAGIAALALLQSTPSLVLLGAFVALFGTVAGSRGPLVAVLSARLFSGGGMGAIYGAIVLGLGLGGAAGSWGAGALHDLTGGYGAGFALGASGAVAGMVLFWTVGALSGRPGR